MPKKGNHKSMTCLFDGITGELIIWDGGLSRTRGFTELYQLKSEEKSLLDYLIGIKNKTIDEVISETGLTNKKIHSLLSSLESKGLVEVKKDGTDYIVNQKIKFKLVKGFEDKKLKKLNLSLQSKEISGKILEALISRTDVVKGIESLGMAKIWKTEEVYLPYWIVVYRNSKGKDRKEIFDPFKGKKDDHIKDVILLRL